VAAASMRSLVTAARPLVDMSVRILVVSLAGVALAVTPNSK
jgi:hypothetical protein